MTRNAKLPRRARRRRIRPLTLLIPLALLAVACDRTAPLRLPAAKVGQRCTPGSFARSGSTVLTCSAKRRWVRLMPISQAMSLIDAYNASQATTTAPPPQPTEPAPEPTTTTASPTTTTTIPPAAETGFKLSTSTIPTGHYLTITQLTRCETPLLGIIISLVGSNGDRIGVGYLVPDTTSGIAPQATVRIPIVSAGSYRVVSNCESFPERNLEVVAGLPLIRCEYIASNGTTAGGEGHMDFGQTVTATPMDVAITLRAELTGCRQNTGVGPSSGTINATAISKDMYVARPFSTQVGWLFALLKGTITWSNGQTSAVEISLMSAAKDTQFTVSARVTSGMYGFGAPSGGLATPVGWNRQSTSVSGSVPITLPLLTLGY